MVRSVWVGVLGTVAGLGLLAGCGKSGPSTGGIVVTGQDGGSDGTPDGAAMNGHDAGGPPSLWTAVNPPALDFEGGSATGPSSGQGQNAGDVHLVSKGALTLDPAQAAPAAPSVPPASGLAVGADALGADVSAAGGIHVSGNLQTSGGDATRQITASSGDIIVDGVLRAADLGGSRQAIALSAPQGTVFVTGTIDTSGSDGSGQAGGAITIQAQSVVVTGKLLSNGGGSTTTGGAGGALTIMTTQSMFVSGNVDTFGGDAQGSGAVTGGAGGALTLSAVQDLTLIASTRMRGGAAVSKGADAKGGDAGGLQIDAAGAVTLGGMVDARGGFAKADGSGGSVAGGAAANLHAGAGTLVPTSLVSLVPVTAKGGQGTSAGGKGATVLLEALNGDLAVRANVDSSGGDSKTAAGAGGDMTGNSGPTSGGIEVTASMKAMGGSIEMGGNGNGGAGATLTLEVKSEMGNLVIQQSGVLDVSGGKSGGTGTAGGGGHLFLFTRDGDLTIAGQLITRGGDAPDPGGTGGLGGAVDVFSDNNHNGLGGHLDIQSTGVIDASGGSGTIGGNARNNGTWGVAAFPTDQEMIAVLINCDGRHGTTWNWLRNDGHIIARGGATNGWGGDIAYHGIAPDGNASPPSGNIDTSADGTGMPGHFRGE